MDKPNIIKGSNFIDTRGTLTFNNNFDTSAVKRVYTVENCSLDFVRGWKGHQIEQRWFSAIQGSFIIYCLKIDNWINPSKDLPVIEFHLSAEKLDILHIPQGYATAIKATSESAKLLSMSDYFLGEVDDEHNFPIDYFKKEF